MGMGARAEAGIGGYHMNRIEQFFLCNNHMGAYLNTQTEGHD